jgi:membrane associated rhomboid family serine protease
MTKINKLILIVFGVLFVGNAFSGQFLGFSIGKYLALSVGGIHTGLITQFVTYPFIETHFMGALFSALLLWFIGSELELKWGSPFYWRFLAFIVLTSGIFFYLVSLFIGGAAQFQAFSGLSGITYGLLLAYGIIYSDRMLTFMLIFPMKAKYFCMLLAGIQLYFGVFSQSKAMGLAHLFSMFAAFAYLRYKSAVARGGGFGEWMRNRQKDKMRQRIRLVDEQEEAPKKADPKNPKYWQ